VSDAGAPFASGQFYWLWAPVNFDHYSTHFDINEYSDGRRWHEVGFVIPDGDEPATASESVGYALQWRPGTRWARGFELDLTQSDGSVKHLDFEPLYEFQMKGLGYFNADWGHGHWKGESAVGAESWDLPVPDPCRPDHLHIQALCRVRCGDDEGLGILEQLIIGAHEPTGLTGAFDPAK
jgi:hypothetical protein